MTCIFVLGIFWDKEMLGHTSKSLIPSMQTLEICPCSFKKIGHAAFHCIILKILTLLYPCCNLERAPSLSWICGPYEESAPFLQFKCLPIASQSSASTRSVMLLSYTSGEVSYIADFNSYSRFLHDPLKGWLSLYIHMLHYKIFCPRPKFYFWHPLCWGATMLPLGPGNRTPKWWFSK